MGPKRVIGLPGETVGFVDNRVIIDGRELPLRQLNRAEFGWVPPVNHIGSRASMTKTATGYRSRRAKASTVPWTRPPRPA